MQRVGALRPGRVDQYELCVRYPNIDRNQPVLSGFDKDLTAAFRTIMASTASMLGYRVAHTLTWRDLCDSQRWIAESLDAKDDACRREAFTKDSREQLGTTRSAEEFRTLGGSGGGTAVAECARSRRNWCQCGVGIGQCGRKFRRGRRDRIAKQSGCHRHSGHWVDDADSIEFAIFLENNRGRATGLLGTAVDGGRSDDTAAVVDRWEVLEGIPHVSVQQP